MAASFCLRKEKGVRRWRTKIKENKKKKRAKSAGPPLSKIQMMDGD